MAHKPIDWKPIFLEALRTIPVISHACRAVGVNRSTAWRAREADEQFAADWDDAIEEGIDNAEQEAYRRAVTGFEEPVVHQGRLQHVFEPYALPDGSTGHRPVLDANGQPVPLTIRKHSDSLLSLYLKGRRKQVYADRTELTGAGGGSVAVVDDTAKAARIAQLMALAKQRKSEEDNSDLA